jgi:hypothetical protein
MDLEQIKRIESIKKEIESAKNQKAVLEGKQEQLLENLKSEFAVDTFEQIPDLLEKLTSELIILENEVKADYEFIISNYPIGR